MSGWWIQSVLIALPSHPPAHFTHFCLPRHTARHGVRPKVKDVHHSLSALHTHTRIARCANIVWTPPNHAGSLLQCCWEYDTPKPLNNTKITLFLAEMAVCIDICSTSPPHLVVERLSLASRCSCSRIRLCGVTTVIQYLTLIIVKCALAGRTGQWYLHSVFSKPINEQSGVYWAFH